MVRKVDFTNIPDSLVAIPKKSSIYAIYAIYNSNNSTSRYFIKLTEVSRQVELEKVFQFYRKYLGMKEDS